MCKRQLPNILKYSIKTYLLHLTCLRIKVALTQLLTKLLIMEEIMNKVTGFLSGLTTVLLSFVSLGILAEVIFGVGVFGVSIVDNLIGMVASFGNGGFVGLVALIILIQLFQNKK